MFYKSDAWWRENKTMFWDGNVFAQFNWDRCHKFHLDLVPQTRQAKLCLDIGVGSGMLTEKIKEKGYNVKGLEFDERAINLATQRGIDVLKIDIEKENLPFERASFDLITCFEVIEHLRSPVNMLQEIHRVLRDDGTFIISTPNVGWWYLRLKLLFGIWGMDEADHIRFFTPGSLRDCLADFGFKAIKIRSLFNIPKLCLGELPCGHSMAYDIGAICIKG